MKKSYDERGKAFFGVFLWGQQFSLTGLTGFMGFFVLLEFLCCLFVCNSCL